MEVINDILNINNYKIVQDTEYFKFSLDSVLLSDFVSIKNKNIKIIDLCTGNCPIPIILSRKVNKPIIGVELQKEIYDLAKKSIDINKLNDKIEILNENVKNLKKIYESDTFDTITCNPPYFKYLKNSKLTKNEIKSIARHEIEVNIDDIINISKYLLKNNGNLAIVHKTERLFEIIRKLENNNLKPKRIQLIYPKENSDSNLVLIEATKNGNEGIKVLKPLFIHNEDGSYREEILKKFS